MNKELLEALIELCKLLETNDVVSVFKIVNEILN